MTKGQIRVGDQVRVFDQNGVRVGQPAGGWIGVVQAVGRKYATISYNFRVSKFELADHYINNALRNRWYATPEEFDLHSRRLRAITTLHEAGITVERNCTLPLDDLETITAMIC